MFALHFICLWLPHSRKDAPSNTLFQLHEQGQLEHTEKFFSTLLADLGNILASSTSISDVWARILYDPFLRQLVLRYPFFPFLSACARMNQCLSNRFNDAGEFTSAVY